MTDPAAMQKQIDDLEFENAEYRRILLGPERRLPLSVHFTPSEDRVLRVLVARAVATDDMIAAALWGLHHEQHWKGIAVRVCQLRKKLRFAKASITHERGIGYSLDSNTRKLLAEKAKAA